MADAKISALTNLTAADPTNDMIPIVDVSDTPPASGNTKRISINNILSSSPTASGALTVTGLVTAGSATITGDLTARTTGLTVNSSGVGVGTSSQSSFLGNSPKKLVVGDGTQTPALTLYGGAANVSGIYFADGTVGNEAYRGFIEYDHATDAFNLGTGGTNAITVNSSRNLAFLDGKGIDFSATANGSGTMTSELLNDYEEGTWTPVVADAASGGNVGTSTIVSATYTKIGRQVSVEFYIMAIGTAGMTAGNALTIRGFPFSAAIQAQGSFYTYRVGRNASTVSSSAFVAASNSIVQFFCFSTNSATTDTRILVSDIVSGTSELRVSVTYFV